MSYSITIKNGLPILVERTNHPVSTSDSERPGIAFGHCIVDGDGFLFINASATDLN
ncbi:hypothetical protein HZ996_10580 [Cryomorphaceae bacterium]|nr:hypothetical protein HZ996_10580 [Cryomorphaceae bacterium]